MVFTFQGIELGNVPIVADLSVSQSINLKKTAIYGSDIQEIEPISVEDDNIQIRVILNKEWTTNTDSVQSLIGLLRGLAQRLSYIHVKDTDVSLLEDSKELLILPEKIGVEYHTGRVDGELVAVVTIDAAIQGTPTTVQGKYVIHASHRNSDFEGQIASRSVVGLPDGSTNSTVTILENRLDTPVAQLGHASTGFANDTTTAVGDDAETGRVLFDFDTTNLEFLKNAIKIYDEGYSPRRRVISKHHQFVGNCTIEADQYKIVVNLSTQKIEMYAATASGSPPTYGSVFERFIVLPFTRVAITHAQDEFARVRLNTGEYVEIERGKDPVIVLARATDALVYEISATLASGSAYDTALYDTGTYVQNQTETTVNYIKLATDLFVCSNRHFQVGLTNKSITATGTPTDQVFQITKTNVVTSGRNREILKEIT